jgi:RimJ/RimL family protein N-acetyltransferase
MQLMPDSPILLDLPEILLGERIAVRSWKAGDGLRLYEAVQESLLHLLPWLPWGPGHESPAVSEQMCREWHARWELREDAPWAILSRDEKRILGGTGLHRMDWHVGSFEIGYWIRASDHGKGYVTEAVQLMTSFAFDYLSANRVFIRCAVQNHRSSAIPKKLGFIHEGVLRNNIKDAHGQLHDADMFALIPGDYRKLSWAKGNQG